MTRAEAYQILDLPYDSNKEDIQKRFTELAVKFKPDESPNEFMQIYSAYKTLTSSSSTFIEDETDIFNDISTEIVDEWEDTFLKLDEAFDAEEKKQQQLEKDRIDQERRERTILIHNALEKVDNIICKENYRNKKALKNLFKQKELLILLVDPEFILGIKNLFTKRDICYEYCSIILKAYDFLIKNSQENLRRIDMRKFLLDKLYHAKDMQPGEINWNLFSGPVMLFAFLNLCNALTLIENLFHIILLCFFILSERFLRKQLHWRKYTAYNISSILCTVILFIFTEYYLAVNNMNIDGTMIIMSIWMPYTLVVGFLSFKRFLMRSSHQKRNQHEKNPAKQ